MKNKLPIIAILTVTSQLALADAANDPDIHAAAAVTEATAVAGAESQAQPAGTQDENTAAPENSLPPLSVEVGSSLQSKLEARMAFELGAQPGREQEIASVQ